MKRGREEKEEYYKTLLNELYLEYEDDDYPLLLKCNQCDEFMLSSDVESRCQCCCGPLYCDFCDSSAINTCEKCNEETCGECLSKDNLCKDCIKE